MPHRGYQLGLIVCERRAGTLGHPLGDRQYVKSSDSSDPESVLAPNPQSPLRPRRPPPPQLNTAQSRQHRPTS